ncbi:hypothetical protein [Halobacterium zhouii]|uniref:hypothetical protein n=1 Tax=Halobacterium zhouii TaxID=2902624 RepID=UPI001E4D1486|nr:hypothetical protein [Halobacterium zhouii]
MKPEFSPLADATGLSIRDPIENAQFELYTDQTVDPTPTSTDQFVLPIDGAVTITVEAIELPRLVDVYLWSSDENLIGESANNEHARYPANWYSLDVDIGPMKLQFVVDSPVTICRDESTTFIEFDGSTTVALGARSLHESPAATITVGDSIEDAARAVSLLGSALKTTSPERSFPTLRGHPPLIERGKSFSAPDGLVTPDTGVSIEIPPSYADLYRVSPLAYYLGADVFVGEGRELHVGDEQYDLNTTRGFESEVTTLLKHVFFLDCVTRTEGFYSMNLHERNLVEDDLTFDLETVYNASLADRLNAYLEVPYDVTEPHRPKWKLTADIEADRSRIETLPFIANELAEVRVPGTEDRETASSEPEELTSFYRSEAALVRSPSDASTSKSNILKPRETDSIEHAWIGDGFPIGASKTNAEFYRQRLERTERVSDTIAIEIVCNDPEMSEEQIVEEFYGTRDFFDFDITVHYELSQSELADVLRSNADFLHYIGHVDEDGFQCADGMLDAHTLDAVNVDAFLLNACQSYEQGEALVERGSLGGIVTLAKITNDPAIRIGRALARLMNTGFSLQAGLSVARNVTLFGNQYITIGDGTLQLVQNSNGIPLSSTLTDLDEGFELTVYGYPTLKTSIGSLVTPYVGDNTTRYLGSGKLDTFEVSTCDLRELLDGKPSPVMVDGELKWSDELLEELLNQGPE